MFLGIDLGTSGVKAVLVDAKDRVLASATSPLDVQRPRPLWSEQDPERWWQATCQALIRLRAAAPAAYAATRGIGLSGQMHGAVLLDESDRVLRPAILWNDGRSFAECRALEEREPQCRKLTGNRAMPGFTAPKLLWVQRHEPELFSRVNKVLLPKDWLRLRLTGEHASDVSDASGTLWLEVAERRWSEAMLAATDLPVEAMPHLLEGTQPSGTLRPQVARELGLREVPVAAGAGDQAAGAAGAGVVHPGQASLSLGTSGVYFVTTDRFAPNPDRAVHAFCHALPDTWHQMAVMLSAASCLSWVTRLCHAPNESAFLAEIEAECHGPSPVTFLPYLSGERTPHDNPVARGVFFGLSADTSRAELGRAVLEGVALAFADCQQALLEGGGGTSGKRAGQGVVPRIDEVSVIGGGARSSLWGRILAACLDRPLAYRAGGEVGPATGAARLGRLAVTDEAPLEVCQAPPVERVIEPEVDWVVAYAERLQPFRQLYASLKPLFAPAPAALEETYP